MIHFETQGNERQDRNLVCSSECLEVLSSLYVAFLPGVKSVSLHSVSVGWVIGNME